MPALTIGSVDFRVAAGAIPVRYEDLGTYRRRSSGTLDVEVRGLVRARVWSPRSIPLARADADVIEAALLASSTVDVSGASIGSPPVTCYVRGVRRSDVATGGATGSGDRCSIDVELVEVGT